MKYELKSGASFEIDEADLDFVKSFKLGILKRSHTSYVKCEDKKTRKYVGLLHNLLLDCPSGYVVDHKDGNGLNCKRINLRVATHSQNMMNRKPWVNEVSGVFFREDRNKWIARITVKKQVISLGSFDTFEEAKAERLKAEALYFGEFSKGI